MPERRPSRGSRPRGTRGPTGPRAARSRSGPAVATTAATTTRSRQPAPRPKLTGRAAILILVVAVLAVSYASSMRAYLQQQEHARELREQIASTSKDITALEREKKRWEDDAFVETQARLRLGYVMPGETAYVVLDENGKALDSPNDLPDADTTPLDVPPAWWETTWGSIELAGNPELVEEDAPATQIGPDE